jgi:hypothetical protein
MPARLPTIFVFLLTLAACSLRLSWPDHSVEFILAGQSSDAVHFTTSDGHDVELYEATVGVDAAELKPCEEKTTSFLRGIGVSKAYAHGIETPTRVATPAVFDAVRDETLIYGALQPPEERYCGVLVELGPMDEDARRLDGTSMVQRSLRLRGRIRPRSADVWRGFQLDSTLRAQQAMDVEIELDPDLARSEVHVFFGVEHWLDGVDPVELTDDPERAASAIILNVRQSIEVRR